MSSASCQASPAPTADPIREWTERFLPALAELVEIGMEIARLTRDQAVEAVARGAEGRGRSDVGELGFKFARVARAVRQTVAFGAKLSEDLAALDSRDRAVRDKARRAEDQRALAALRAQGTRRKEEAAEIFEMAVEARTPDADREDLLADLADWRDAGHCDEVFADRPIEEIIGEICRDLGVSPNWSRLSQDQLERIESRPSLAAAGFAVWPPGPAGAPGRLPDLVDPRPPPRLA